MIKINNLYKSFGKNVVFRGLNLEIRDGKTITIIGGSGCGKSVLIKHIVGLLKPDSGEIFIDDKEITKLKEDELFEIQKKFGFLFQGAALFDSLTVKENVAFGLRNLKNMTEEAISEKVKECLTMIGLEGIENMKPSELSGGMKKRVALARAIATDPKYILYDEPTTGIDPIMADVINDLIIHLQKTLGVTSIVVTHDMTSAYKISNHIAMLFEGKIIGEGSSEEIKNTKNPYIKQFTTGSSTGPIKMKMFES
ncbi:MAG: ABC transporter ATP-binding protein [Elusimicrobia bacterium RIFOXYD2_FULL_34_15]|nr:MAG: ABC transporter ATP-binding protein [Elusimicrobia bacterium RIFOXYD2_FULL_34_15]